MLKASITTFISSLLVKLNAAEYSDIDYHQLNHENTNVSIEKFAWGHVEAMKSENASTVIFESILEAI